MSWARFLADLVVLVHFAYVGFVVFGLIAILIGLAARQHWTRNFWFRTIHLGMIAIVVLESWAGLACPLTTLEKTLRRHSGQATSDFNFLEYWIHRLMFFHAPPWMFAAIYTAFGLGVLLAFVLGPPRWPRRVRGMP
jgi:hypothetical protein